MDGERDGLADALRGYNWTALRVWCVVARLLEAGVPTVDEIAVAAGLNRSTVYKGLRALRLAGRVEWERGRARSLRLLERPSDGWWCEEAARQMEKRGAGGGIVPFGKSALVGVDSDAFDADVLEVESVAAPAAPVGYTWVVERDERGRLSRRRVARSALADNMSEAADETTG